MKPIKTWIVIADGEHARFLMNSGPGKGLEEAPAEDMETEIPPSREITTDRPGRSFNRQGPGRHAMEHVQYRRFEEDRFASEVSKILENAAKDSAFDRLVLVAPPKTLGDLRKHIGNGAAKRIHGEIDKDLIQASDDVLRKNLGEVMAL